MKTPMEMQENLVGYKYVNDLAHTLIEEVELEIGGQVVDKHYENGWTFGQNLHNLRKKIRIL